jgi:hypothetical protein
VLTNELLCAKTQWDNPIMPEEASNITRNRMICRGFLTCVCGCYLKSTARLRTAELVIAESSRPDARHHFVVSSLQPPVMTAMPAQG